MERAQGLGFSFFEELAGCAVRGAVQASIGLDHPAVEVALERDEVVERTPGDSVALHVLHAALDLALRAGAAAAISLALGLWGLVGLTSPAVRTRVSPNSVVGDAARHHWATLGRWVVAGAAGGLFPRLSVIADEDRRVTAGRLATALIGFAPPSDRHLTREDQLYLGGARAA